MRTFVSIEIPDDIKNKIEKLVNKLKLMLTPIKWVDKKNLHVTLKFIGWVNDEKVPPLIDCIKGCAGDFGSFDLSFSGLGVFPSAKRPRVIWIGTSAGADKVKKLGDCIEAEVAKEGVCEEEREFSPHLTIGGIKEKIDVGALNDFIEKNKDIEFGSFRVDHVSMMKSTLRRSGPIYEEIEKIKI
jgi:RNA 2',3'-cyclic 3'-phosphodiesterase